MDAANRQLYSLYGTGYVVESEASASFASEDVTGKPRRQTRNEAKSTRRSNYPGEETTERLSRYQNVPHSIAVLDERTNIMPQGRRSTRSGPKDLPIKQLGGPSVKFVDERFEAPRRPGPSQPAEDRRARNQYHDTDEVEEIVVDDDDEEEEETYTDSTMTPRRHRESLIHQMRSTLHAVLGSAAKRPPRVANLPEEAHRNLNVALDETAPQDDNPAPPAANALGSLVGSGFRILRDASDSLRDGVAGTRTNARVRFGEDGEEVIEEEIIASQAARDGRLGRPQGSRRSREGDLDIADPYDDEDNDTNMAVADFDDGANILPGDPMIMTALAQLVVLGRELEVTLQRGARRLRRRLPRRATSLFSFLLLACLSAVFCMYMVTTIAPQASITARARVKQYRSAVTSPGLLLNGVRGGLSFGAVKRSGDQVIERIGRVANAFEPQTAFDPMRRALHSTSERLRSGLESVSRLRFGGETRLAYLPHLIRSSVAVPLASARLRMTAFLDSIPRFTGRLDLAAVALKAQDIAMTVPANVLAAVVAVGKIPLAVIRGIVSRWVASEATRRSGRTDRARDQVVDLIELIAADKGGEPDYALLSTGAKVISSTPSHGRLYLRFVRNWVVSLAPTKLMAARPPQPNRPSIALTPDISPGNCWAFPGAKGSITIRLARPIVPSSITVEHTPKSATFSVASAPKDFAVSLIPLDAADSEEDAVAGGTYQYETYAQSRHMQQFWLPRDMPVVRAVRIDVLSNHGSPYTCLYRVRVHGEDAQTLGLLGDGRALLM